MSSDGVRRIVTEVLAEGVPGMDVFVGHVLLGLLYCGRLMVINTLFFELCIIEKGTVGCPSPLQTQILNSPIMSKVD